MTSPMPEKPALEGLEARWGQSWEDSGTYRFDRGQATRASVFSIDTPPPTASGSLHIGHVFSYTHTDVKARFERMRGASVFYPMGWDDNGLPTERRVQNFYGVRCDPSLPYDAGFTPPFEGGDNKSAKAADQVPISRRNFVELCERLTVEDEKQFEDVWRKLGLSVDWTQSYRTIGQEAQVASQRAFLRNLARGEAYQADAPTLWDVTFRTAVAQAELEDREQPSAYHRLAFHRPGGDDVIIDTTRPELLAACVALVAWFAGSSDTARRLRRLAVRGAGALRRRGDALGIGTGRVGVQLYRGRVVIRTLVALGAATVIVLGRPLEPALVVWTLVGALVLVAVLEVLQRPDGVRGDAGVSPGTDDPVGSAAH